MQDNTAQNSVNPEPVVTTPLVSEPTPVQPVETKKVSSLMIVVGVIFVILLSTTGFLAYQNMQLQNEIAGLKAAQNVVVNSPTPVATVDPTAKISESAKAALMDSSFKSEITQGREIQVSDVQINQGWAMGNLILTAVGNGGPSDWKFIAKEQNGDWIAAVEYSQQYLGWFPEAGKLFMSEEAYNFLLNEHYQIN